MYAYTILFQFILRSFVVKKKKKNIINRAKGRYLYLCFTNEEKEARVFKNI